MTHERLRFAVEHDPIDVFKADLTALLKERDELAALVAELMGDFCKANYSTLRNLEGEARRAERIKTLEQMRLIAITDGTPRMRLRITELLKEADKAVQDA